jgi:hypothetical protein
MVYFDFLGRRRRHPVKIVGSKVALALIAIAVAADGPARAQQATAQSMPAEQHDTFLLTIFFKHDQSKSLDEINAELAKRGFYKAFPPPGIEVVSWYVMMGIGQVVTLRVPAERLREVNRVIEQTAWGGYRTEFYVTYDYKAVGEEEHAKAH